MGKVTSTKGLIYILFLTLLISGFFVVFNKSTWVSCSEGTIDSSYKCAWGENIGWVNFGCDNCNVHVTDTALSGYALSETVGWINLEDVVNDGQGNLSGLAWGEKIGYIKFKTTKGRGSFNS